MSCKNYNRQLASYCEYTECILVIYIAIWSNMIIYVVQHSMCYS